MKPFLYALLVCSTALPQSGPVNLDFEAGTVGRTPAGWQTSAAAAGFQATLVEGNCRQGRHCAVLGGAGVAGNLYQVVVAEPFIARLFSFRAVAAQDLTATRRMRFRAAVRVEGPGTVARLWFRVDRRGGGNSLHNTADIAAGPWNEFQIDADIAPDCKQMVVGLLVSGPGKAWIDAASLTDVKKNASAAPRRPARANWKI